MIFMVLELLCAFMVCTALRHMMIRKLKLLKDRKMIKHKVPVLILFFSLILFLGLILPGLALEQLSSFINLDNIGPIAPLLVLSTFFQSLCLAFIIINLIFNSYDIDAVLRKIRKINLTNRPQYTSVERKNDIKTVKMVMAVFFLSHAAFILSIYLIVRLS